MEKIKIVALVGEAGSGKDSVVDLLMQKNPNKFHKIISDTTRPPRDYEVDGQDYYFKSNEEFTLNLLNGTYLEASMFNDWGYATNKNRLSKDKINLGVFNLEGIESLMEYNDINLQVFKLNVKPSTRLIRQLSREEYPNIDEIFRRYKTDNWDFADIKEDFPDIIYIDNNHNIQDCVLEILDKIQ